MKRSLLALTTALALFAGGCHWTVDDASKGGGGIGCNVGGCASCGLASHGGGCHACGTAGGGHISGDFLANMHGAHGAGPIAHTPGGVGILGHHHQRAGVPGPPSAQVTYPYYTTRGPRDFFTNEPSTIGY